MTDSAGSAPEPGPSPLRPGAKLRFYVGTEDGRRGSSWTVETGRTTDDVYLFHREGGRWVKSSFHASGQWHHSVMPAGRERLGAGQSPYLGVTHERAPIADGWFHASRITVDLAELRVGVEAGRALKGAVCVPPRPGFPAVCVDLYVAESEHARIQVDDAFLVGVLDRVNGGQACVIARGMGLEEPVREKLRDDVEHARGHLKTQGWDGVSPTRIVVYGNDPDGGFHREIELAIDP